jgi:hypothetical protein
MALKPAVRVLRAAALALSVAACGTADQDPIITAVDIVTDGLRNGTGGSAPAPVLTAETLPADLLQRIDAPLILVETPQLGGATLMTRVGRNGPDSTWRSPEGWGITLGTGNILRSTRGLGYDLMASDPGATATLLAARRAGSSQRVTVHLDGDGNELRRTQTCTLSPDGPETIVIVGQARRLSRISETCQTPDGTRQNLYWLDDSGSAVQSVQWVGPRIGTLRITTLAD